MVFYPYNDAVFFSGPTACVLNIIKYSTRTHHVNSPFGLKQPKMFTGGLRQCKHNGKISDGRQMHGLIVCRNESLTNNLNRTELKWALSKSFLGQALKTLNPTRPTMQSTRYCSAVGAKRMSFFFLTQGWCFKCVVSKAKLENKMLWWHHWGYFLALQKAT